MSEYIGSRISLISKSDIKYVGTLHEINSENSTIALENVTSYGTEGRRGDPSQEQPGSDQIYEYIVFRGSDVKELSMVEAPKENQPPAMPNDPAIMGSTRPPQQQAPNQQPPQFRNQPGQQQPPYPPPYGFPQGPPPPQFQQQARFQGPGGPHGFPGSPGAVPGYGGMGGFAPPPPGYGMPPPYGPPPPGQGFGGPPPPGAFSPNNQPMPIGPPGQQRPQMQGPGQGPVGNGSKQGTPQPAPAQAPQPPVAQANTKPESSGTPASTSATPATAPPPPVESKPSPAAATAPPQAPQQKPAKKPTDSRIALPLAPNTATKPAAPKQAPASSQATPAAVAQPSSYADATHAATAAVAAAMAKLAPGSQQPQVQQTGGSMDNLAQKVNQMRVQDAPARGRGRGRGRGVPAGVRRESAHKPVEVPTEDYDFESANAKFNKQDLVKQQIASGEPMPSQQNGAAPESASNGHTEVEDVVIPAKPGAEKGYDKQSSFFDNISSDLKDRQVAQGEMIDGRAMRRDERNKNVDTFGQGSVDNGYRGGFRGRGRGGRGFSRGGPRGNGFAPRGRGRGGAGEPALV